MGDLEQAAREWLALRMRVLELKRATQAEECEWAGDYYDEDFDVYSGPCWVPDPRTGVPIPLEDRCDACQRRESYYQEYKPVSKLAAVALRRLYRIYRREAER